MSSNPWNDFQHDHAGEELSPGEMSEMYHAEQDGGESSAELMATADMTNTSENATDTDSGVMFEATPDLDTEVNNGNSHEDIESEAYNQDEESTNSGNRWNDFQHEHAGEGHSHAEMSELYHAEQTTHEPEPETSEVTVHHNDEESISSNDTSLENTETDSGTNGNPDNDIREPSKDESSSSNNNVSTEGNQWNDFQHQHKGEGKTSSELSDMYHQQQQEQQSQEEETLNNAQEGESQSAPDERNKFEHEHKDQNLTHQEMSAMYHQQQPQEAQPQQQQEQQKQTVNNVQEGASQSALNEWNKFQHEHKDQNLTQQEMSVVYHQQQQERQRQPQQEERVVNNLQHDAAQLVPNKSNKSEPVERNQQFSSKETADSHSQQNQPKQNQKPKASVQWNLFQHLYGGKGLTRQGMESKYIKFKENEQTFRWKNEYQLVVTSDGKLQNPNSPAGHEAIKTGLFDEKSCLRRRGDLPFSVFQAKMFAMGITDRSKISSMYLNNTGSTALHTANLRQDSYKQHAAVGTMNRDPDHILELQVVASELHKEHLNEENFHTLRCVLNGEHNIESRGVKVNRFIKRAANGGIARNYIKLTNFTFKQELVQANQASKLADLCHEQGSLGAETVLRRLADKCNSLHSIHEQVMQLNDKTMDTNEQGEREHRLVESIRNYESEYGSLNFHKSSMTEYRKEILDKAHRV